jgi:hypothetical protein
MSIASSTTASIPKQYIKLKDTLGEVKNSLQSISSDNPFKKYTDKINFACIEEKLKLADNGEKSVTIYEGQVIILSAYLKCFDGDEVETVNSMIRDIGLDQNKDFVHCSKENLQKIDPDSKLIENFDIKSYNASMILMCGYLKLDEALEITLEHAEQVVGPLDTFTCGAISKLDARKFLLNLYVVPYETRDEVRTPTIKEMLDTFKTKITKTADCIISNA